MNKKFLEKDGFYLALFACVCVVALGGVMFTKNNVDKLASEQGLISEKNNEDEIHLIDKEEDSNADDNKVQTSTESEDNLEKAKEEEQSQEVTAPKEDGLFMGSKVINKHDDIYESETLDVWQVHKGIDVAMNDDQDVKSLLNGKVTDVYNDDAFGMSVKIESDNDVVMVYSNLQQDIKVKKGNDIKEGQIIGKVGNTSVNEGSDLTHIHIQAFKADKEIDPMTLVK